LAEFAYNNFITQATQLTPFYTNSRYHPKTIWISSEKFKNPASKAYAQLIKVTHDRAMQALEKPKTIWVNTMTNIAYLNQNTRKEMKYYLMQKTSGRFDSQKS
jgi:hypothetical protein